MAMWRQNDTGRHSRALGLRAWSVRGSPQLRVGELEGKTFPNADSDVVPPPWQMQAPTLTCTLDAALKHITMAAALAWGAARRRASALAECAPAAGMSSVARPPHHTASGRFDNPVEWVSYKWPDFKNIVAACVLPAAAGKRKLPPPTLPPHAPLSAPRRLREWDFSMKFEAQPSTPPQWEAAAAAPCSATWLGHVGFVVQLGDVRVLLDPVFCSHASPIQGLGPGRFTPPPCAVEELPSVDVIILSHNHYDHADVGSLRKLAARAAREDRPTKWVVPLGLSQWLTGTCGVPPSAVQELDWWQGTPLSAECGTVCLPEEWSSYSTRVALPRAQEESKPHAQLQAEAEAASPAPLPPCIVALPAQHNSARTPFDRNVSLWAGFALVAPEGRVLFTGDTGYRAVPPGTAPHSAEEDAAPVNPTFTEVGDRLGPFDLGLLPIGAYSPRRFMCNVHASPEDAVEMHVDTRCRRSVGMHWGTFPLTDEPAWEPPVRLAAATAARGLPADAFVALQQGGTLTPDGPLTPEQLWTRPEREE